jgi:hypothetical protein
MLIRRKVLAIFSFAYVVLDNVLITSDVYELLQNILT